MSASQEDLEESVASAREEVRRLTALAEDLLVIAQGDQQRLPIIAERFEVHGAMRVIADRYSHLEELAGRRVIDPVRSADVHRGGRPHAP